MRPCDFWDITLKEFWVIMRAFLQEKGVDLDAKAKQEENYQKMLEKHGQPTVSIRNG